MSKPREKRRKKSKSNTRQEKTAILRNFPRLSQETKEIILSVTKGNRVLLLRLRTMNTLLSYESITVRMLYYRLVAVYFYKNDLRFYKRLQYSLKVLRKLFPVVHYKFEDPTRPLRVPMMAYRKIEIWVEKSSLEFFLRRHAGKYHVPITSERGFGSLTMFRNAIDRASRRGVRKILFISDHDPSGLMIEEVTKREVPIELERIALTMEQIKKYRLPSIKVKKKDSRAKKYIAKYGDRAWEVEALPPRTLLRIVEQELKKNIPREFLEKLELEKEAMKITKPLEKKLAERLRSVAIRLKREGLSDKEILRVLESMYNLEE